MRHLGKLVSLAMMAVVLTSAAWADSSGQLIRLYYTSKDEVKALAR
ncbi:MAG: hypothetical protein HY814_13865, partial [Candidatus Riflebacteria bacterium]|nr:hypothetical protein [Candidatus Riflebacteria bacterium]